MVIIKPVKNEEDDELKQKIAKIKQILERTECKKQIHSSDL